MSDEEKHVSHLESEVKRLNKALDVTWKAIDNLFQDKPDENGNYFHLIWCNGSNKYPIGAEGKLCNCKRSPLFSRLYEYFQSESSRLRRGEFNDFELQNLCHNLDEKDKDKDKFIKGCSDYQKMLFGQSERQRLFNELNKIYLGKEGDGFEDAGVEFIKWFEQEFKEELNGN